MVPCIFHAPFAKATNNKPNTPAMANRANVNTILRLRAAGNIYIFDFMLFNPKNKKVIKTVFAIVAILTIVGMVAMYIPSLYY